MINITDKSLCCGCTACKSVCPVDAITMRPDGLGFLYPEVDNDKCINCHKCEQVCDFQNERTHADVDESDRIQVFALVNKDRQIQEQSQSGGAFTPLAESVLARGGVVYGAAFDEDFNVSHKRVKTKGQLAEIRGSKYVQSNLNDTFRNVLLDLQSGLEVLFAGTPCQVKGLSCFVPEQLHEKLYLVDFVCHGVPSPQLWSDYVKFVAKGRRLSQVKFRDKSVAGWNLQHWETFTFEDGTKDVRETFKMLFYKNLVLRDGCFRCPYSSLERHSDVTIADFWGIDQIMPDFFDNGGTSMLLCNTDKGVDMFDEVFQQFRYAPINVPVQLLSKKNPHLFNPVIRPKDRDKLESIYKRDGFEGVADRWADTGWRYKAWKLKVGLKTKLGL